MQKTVFTKDYKTLLLELRATRIRAGLAQKDVADRLGQTQSFISKCERGERRLDVLELRVFCKACGVSLPSFIRRLEKSLTR